MLEIAQKSLTFCWRAVSQVGVAKHICNDLGVSEQITYVGIRLLIISEVGYEQVFESRTFVGKVAV